jgi:hypothetical protein
LNRPKACPYQYGMKRAIMTAMMLLGSVLTAQAANTTSTYAFKDIAMPNGQARHVDEERADALACGVTKTGKSTTPRR